MPNAGNSLGTATFINLNSTVQTFADTVTTAANDYYRFTLNNRSSFNLSLTGLSADANVELLNQSGNPLSIGGIVQNSANTGRFAESINATLEAGTYYIHVSPGTSNPADYSLNVSVSTTLATDILWRNYATGQNVAWFMNGTAIEAVGSLLPVGDLNFQIQGTGDFNRDGQTDIIWRNNTTAETVIWMMNGIALTSVVSLSPVVAPGWQVAGTGDFDQDGQTDLLWRNDTTGATSFWFMNGTTIRSTTSLSPIVDSNWKIQGVGDFNRDGRPDLLWRNYATGQNSVWFMNGTTLKSVGTPLAVGDLNWHISGTGDYNRDGQADILWRNFATGENVIWMMNGVTIGSIAPLPVVDLNLRSFSPFIRTITTAPIDVAGNSLPDAFNIGTSLTGTATYRDGVGGSDPGDYYRFNLSAASNVNLSLTGLAANLDLQVLDSNGIVVQSSTLGSATSESIITPLAAGTYYARVYPNGSSSSTYALNLSVNNLPVLATNNPLLVTEGSAANLTSTILRVLDNDNTAAQLTYTLGTLPGKGNLLFNGTTLSTGATFTQADIDNGSRLRYQHDGSETTTDSFTFTVSDGVGGTLALNTVNIAVTPANDAPVLAVPAGVQAADQGANSTIFGTQITDVDAGSGNVTVTLDAANGFLTLGLRTGLTFAQGTGIQNTRMIFSGTLTAVNNAINALIYRSQPTFQGTDTISITVNDNGNTGVGGALSDSKSIAVRVTPINQAPIITLPSTPVVNEDVSFAIAGISIADVDGLGGNVTVSLSAVNGVLSLNSTSGLNLITGDGTQDRNIAFSGPLALVNAALNNLVYLGDKDFNGSDFITVNVNDSVSSGNGGVPLSDTKVLSVTVAPVNDQPLLTVPGAQVANENTSLRVTGISVSDVDALSGNVTVSLSVGNGTLALGSVSGISFSGGTGNQSASLIFSGTLAAINSALNTLTYKGGANFNGTDTINISVNDNGNTGSGIALSDSKAIAINVLGVNNAPVITVPLAPSTNAGVDLAIAGVSVSDPDAGSGLFQVTIAAANGVLSIPTQNLTFLQGDGVFDSRLTFTGTLSAINSALAGLSYRSNPSFTGFETIAISVNDQGNTGIGTPLSDSRTLFVNVGGATNNPPTANSETYSVLRNTVLNVPGTGVLANDIDTDSATLNAVLVDLPTQGSLSLSPTGSFTYTPISNVTGTDTFTYRASDGIATSNLATVTINITVPANTPPVASPDTFLLNEDTPRTGNVLTNDLDTEDGRPPIAQLVTGPAHALNFTLNSDGSFSYTPTANYNGNDSFTYIAKDSAGLSSSPTTVTLSIAPVNDAPIAVNDTIATFNEDTSTSGNVLTNDTDVEDNRPAIAQLITGPSHAATFTLNGDGSFNYTPVANYSGVDSLTYIAKDSAGLSSNTATVNFSIAPVNDLPTAANDSFSVSAGGTLNTQNVLTNDTDVEDTRPTVAQLVTAPTNALSFNLNADGSFTYVPNTGATSDSFTYIAKDSTGAGSNTATVNITVTSLPNTAPTAVNDAIATFNEDTPTSGNVLTNDLDTEDGRPTAAQLITGPAHAATFTLNNDGSFSYTPTANYNGTDSFTYLAKDSAGLSSNNTATVSLSIAPVNDAPIAVNDTIATFNEDTSTSGNVLTNDTDVEDTRPTVTQLVTGPAHAATFTLNSDGSFNYTPVANYNGVDSFTYIAKDSAGLSSGTATVNLSIAPVNDLPTAVNDSFSVSAGGTINTQNVLNNDNDIEDTRPTVAQIVTAPTNALSFNLNADGSFTYVPNTGATSDSFTYIAKDSTGASSNTATVSITVTTLPNTAPTAVDDLIPTFNEDTSTSGNVLTNDTDTEDGRPTVAQLVTGPAHALNFTLNNDGSFSYTPTANYNGVDSFTYIAKDSAGLGSNNTATVNLSIAPVNDAPIAVDDNLLAFNEDTSISGNVLSNDTDVEDNLPAIAQLITGPTHAATFTLNTDGSFNYTPVANYNGTDSFTYIAKDSAGLGSNTATVNLSITPVNDLPTAADDSFSMSAGGTLNTQNVLTNDTDIEDTRPTVAQIVTNPTNALSFSLNADGTFTYVPNTGATSDSFTYIAKDSSGASSNTATVSITISSLPNTAPTAVDDLIPTFNEDTSTSGNVLTNDTDTEDGRPTVAQLVTGPAHALNFTLNNDGSFSYTPTANYNGTDSFTYIAKDSAGLSSNTTATVNLSIAPVNDAPIAVNDTLLAFNEDTSISGNVLSNDTDVEDNLPAIAQLITGPAHAATFTLNTDGSFNYTPVANYNGTDSFTYIAKDSAGLGSNTATVNLSITPVNDLPTAADDSFSMSAGGTLNTQNVLSNDTDIEDTRPTVAQLVTAPTNALSFTLNGDGTFTYVPNTGATSDSFTYIAKDSTGASSNTATVSITISNLPNTAPTAVDDLIPTFNEDTATSGNVLTNDTDAEDVRPTVAQLVTGPAHALNFTLNNDGSFSYTPTANYNGTDSFTYIAKDSAGLSSNNTATVNLSIAPVNDLPIAVNDLIATFNEDTSINGNVLTNDTDVEDTVPAIAQLITGPAHATTFTLNSDGSFTYTPTANYNGSDSFTYIAKDSTGASSGTATVNLSIAPVNDTPIAVNDGIYRVATNSDRTIPLANTILQNDTDIDGQTLSAVTTVTTSTSGAAVTVNADGTFIYRPTNGFNGTDTFIYQATDGVAVSNPATVTVSVGPNTAPIAQDDNNSRYRTVPGGTLTVAPIDSVLQNDSDTDGPPPLNAVATVTTSASGGNVTLNADGSFTYTPAVGFTGPTDTFTYQATDGLATSGLATVTITVSTNSPPIAVDDSDPLYRTFPGAALTISAIDGVLRNDSDGGDGPSLNAVAAVTPTSNGGTVTLNANGSFVYTPATGFTGPLDTFTYQVTDGIETSTPATVTVTVAANNPPIAVDDTGYRAPAGGTLFVGSTNSVLANDSSGDLNQSVQAVGTVTTTTNGGTVTLNVDGSFSYTPRPGFTNANDTFTYRVTDGIAVSSPATVTLSVFTNTAPTVGNDSYSTSANNSLTIASPGVLSNDSDLENSITSILVDATTHGSVLLRSDGSFVYTPTTGYTGNDFFTYRAYDGFTNSSLATVSIAVSPNAAPTANPDSYSVNLNNVLTVPYSVFGTTFSGVLGNDVDTDPLTASLVSGPSKGNLAFFTDGSFTYTPTVVVGGTDTFVYQASDGTATSNATVTITIKASSTAPTATNDSFTTNANSVLSVPVAQSILKNDTDADGDRLTARVTAQPTNGTVTVSADGSFVYTPNANFASTDTFTYVASDGVSDSNPATVTINVGSVNRPPVVTVPGSQVVFNNTDLIISGLQVSDPDAGSNPVRVTLTASNGDLTLGTTSNVTVIDADGDNLVVIEGSITNINTALTNLKYTPDDGYTGGDAIQITVDDKGNTGSSGGNQIGNGSIAINVTSGAALVKDINQNQNTAGTGTESSALVNFAAIGNILYFAADDGFNGKELWKSDGTATGTVLVGDINTGTGGSSNPANMTLVGNTLFFSANNGVAGVELWKVDLPSGTPTLVKNIRSSGLSSNPGNLVNFNGTLFFRADDGSGTALWKSDGTSVGTVKVGTGYSQPASLTVVGNTLYFTASNGTQLWKSDGTTTTQVKDLGVTTTGTIAIGNTLFFTTSNGSTVELWRSDGTSTGTQKLSALNAGLTITNPNSLVNLNGTLYFLAKNGANFGLYKSTEAGIVSLVQNLSSTGQAPSGLTVAGSTLFFTLDVGTTTTPDIQLWKSNGTTASLVKDINVTGNANPASLTSVNGTLFFTANDGSTRLWRSDGTDAGTAPVSVAFTGAVPSSLTAVGSRLFFTADTTATGTELWVV